MGVNPWWRTDNYALEVPLPLPFHNRAGPKGLALVRAFDDGRTTGGWGTDPSAAAGTFMENYNKAAFASRRALHGYEKNGWPFAIVMRSVNLVCVDIDGKNGGLIHAKKLGALPPTLAETSKSGDGYHLFYTLDEDWDPDLGFGELHDRIGVEQGVDIRATGCVYHYPQQRWNNRTPVPMPKYLRDMLMTKQQDRVHRAVFVSKVVQSGDETEILMMQDALLDDLAKPIAAGKRNNTLFAIGQQMKTAQIPNWEQLLQDRATEVGLDADEVEKLVTNVARYN
jgi:hypothetical protein